MPEAVAIGTTHVALGDLLLERLPTEVTAGAIGMTQVDALHSTHMVEFHDLGRELDTAVDAWTIEGRVERPANPGPSFSLIFNGPAALLFYAVRAFVVLAIVRGSRGLLFVTQVFVPHTAMSHT